MRRLEGDSLPVESRGQIVPWAFGDVLLDVPGIPLQIGWQATLADNCGADDSQTTFRLSGPDLAEIIATLTPSLPLVAQIENEWVRVVSFGTAPFSMTVDARGFSVTDPAEHAKGTTVLFIESRALYVFLEAPTGLRYPDDALVQLRANDVAQTPPCTVRLQDDRIVEGARFVTAEFDLTRYFGGVQPVQTPGALVTTFQDPAVESGTPWISFFTPNPSGAPAPPTPPAASRSKTARAGTARVVLLRQTPLGRVSADLKGLLDTVGGRYTGTASAPIIRPADVTRVKLELTYSQDAAGFYEPEWLTTRANQTSAGLAWRSLWYGDAFETFRATAGFCGLTDLWIDESGRWRNTWRDPAGTPVATVTARELVDEMPLDFIPPSATRLEVSWGDRLQAGAFTLDSLAMQARFGIITDRSLALPYVASETMARAVAAHWLAAWDHSRLTAGRVVFAPALSALSLTDHVMVDTPLLELYGARRVPWEIRGVADGGAQRTMVLVEGDPIGADGYAGTLDGSGSIWHLLTPDQFLTW